MDRKRLQSLIDSLESLKRATQEAAVAFDAVEPEEIDRGWFVFDPDER